MKYGMPTLVMLNSIYENVDFALKNNLDFIELNMDLPYCSNIKNQELNKFNIEFTMHISEKINVADLNNNLRIKYLNKAIRQIKLGINNNIKKFNLHLDSGVYFTLPSGKYYLNEKFLDIYLKNLDKSCKVLDKFANEHNIEINFENTKIHSFTKEAFKVIERYKYLGFTLDIGHNEKNCNKAYELLKDIDKIRHIHMHDYDGKKDHLTLGNGIIDFQKYDELINKNYVVIEIKEESELINSIKYLNS